MRLGRTEFLWFHIIPLVPSLLVTIFILYHLLKNRALHNALNNHVIILMLAFGLILELTDTVWFIHFYRTGQPVSSTPTFCLAWAYIDSTLFVSITLLMTWASIERHILIFHPHWFETKIKCFCFHYVPLFVTSVWPLIFYLIMLVILPCDAPFNYERRLCGHYDCVNTIAWVAMFDSVVHYMVPAFIIVIFSGTLFLRVIYHKYRVRRRIEWRNYKKMSFQLLSISLVYMIIEAPPMILNAAYLAGLSWDVGADFYANMLDLSLWVILFTPFASTTSLPDFNAKCRKLFCFWKTRNTIHPAVITNTERKPASTRRSFRQSFL